jgi:sporulation protein YlmC with PRC-barrel domain
VNWRDLRGLWIRRENGGKVGRVVGLRPSRNEAKILLLATVPRTFLRYIPDIVKFGSFYVPTQIAREMDREIVVPETFEPDEELKVKAKELPKLKRLINTEAYAGRGWRIGRLVDADIDPSSWMLEKLAIDVYPEYLISLEARREAEMVSFPPLMRVTVPGEGVEFVGSDSLERSYSVVLPVAGRDVEKHLIKEIEAGDSSDRGRDGVIQTAFENAYREKGLYQP